MKIGFIGMGNMAKAIADGFISSRAFDEKLKKEAAKEPRIILVDISSL